MVTKVVTASSYDFMTLYKMHWDPGNTQVTLVTECGHRSHFCFKAQAKRKMYNNCLHGVFRGFLGGAKTPPARSEVVLARNWQDQ